MKFLLAHSTCDTFKFDDPCDRLAHFPPFGMSCFCLFSHIDSASVFDQMFDAFGGRFWHPFGIVLASKTTCFLCWFFNVFLCRIYAKMYPKRDPKMTSKTTLLAQQIRTFPLEGRVWESLAHLGWFWRLFGAILVAFYCLFAASWMLFGSLTGLPWDPGCFSANVSFFAPSYCRQAPSSQRIPNLPLSCNHKLAIQASNFRACRGLKHFCNMFMEFGMVLLFCMAFW